MGYIVFGLMVVTGLSMVAFFMDILYSLTTVPAELVISHKECSIKITKIDQVKESSIARSTIWLMGPKVMTTAMLWPEPPLYYKITAQIKDRVIDFKTSSRPRLGVQRAKLKVIRNFMITPYLFKLFLGKDFKRFTITEFPHYQLEN